MQRGAASCGSSSLFENNPAGSSSTTTTSVIASTNSGGGVGLMVTDSEKTHHAVGVGVMAATSNGERVPNFSKLDMSMHMGEHRSTTTTSGYFNKMNSTIGGVTCSLNASNKPGDVKKIVIKNFKGKYETRSLLSIPLIEDCFHSISNCS